MANRIINGVCNGYLMAWSLDYVEYLYAFIYASCGWRADVYFFQRKFLHILRTYVNKNNRQQIEELMLLLPSLNN